MGRVSVVHPRGRGILRKVWIEEGDYGRWKSVPSYEAEGIRHMNRTIEIGLNRGYYGKVYRWEGYPEGRASGIGPPDKKFSVVGLVNEYWDKLSPRIRQKFTFSKIDAIGYRKLDKRDYDFISHNFGYFSKPEQRLVIRESGRWQVEGIARTHALKQIMERPKKVAHKPEPIAKVEKKPIPIAKQVKKPTPTAKPVAKVNMKPTPTAKQVVPKELIKIPVIHPRPKHHPLHKK